MLCARQVRGTSMGTPGEFEELLEHMVRYKLVPVVDSQYPLQVLYGYMIQLKRNPNYPHEPVYRC